MKKVLIVDDSASVRQVVNETLRKAGFTVVEAIDGDDGISVLKKDTSIAMIICDVNMPRMNGLEMVERIAEDRKAGLPIVMLTTEVEPSLIERAKKAGARGWIVKPFKPELLVNAVQRLTAA